VLDGESTEGWLSGAGARDELLKPAPDDALRMWPVSGRVNKPGNCDDPTLIDPVTVHSAAEPRTRLG
jgi:putative SOS response-associated peptidase YedK